jgi:hypothetical protein
VYSLYVEPGIGYRTKPGRANGVAVGDEPETMYMVTSGKHYNDRCCFDYGNAEANAHDDGRWTCLLFKIDLSGSFCVLFCVPSRRRDNGSDLFRQRQQLVAGEASGR